MREGERENRRGKYGLCKSLGAAVLGAVCLAGLGAGTALADEDLERITEIHLNIESEITAGSYDNDVDVDTDDDAYIVGGAEFTNGEGEWYGGVIPRLEIILYAEDGYYFGGNSRSMFSFSGADVDYVSSHREDDNTTLVVVVDLEELEQEDLEIGDVWWSGSYGMAAWEDVPAAKYYQVRLYRNGSSVGSTKNVYNSNEYNFRSEMTRSGRYYFEVRAVGSGSAKSEWEQSDVWELDDADAEALSSRNYGGSGSKYSDDDDDYDDDGYDDNDYDYDDKWDSLSDSSVSRSNVYASDHSHESGPGVASSHASSEDSSEGGPGVASSDDAGSEASSEDGSGGSSSGSNVSSASSVPKGSSSASGSGSNVSASNSKNSIGGVKTGEGNEWRQDQNGWWFLFSDGSYAFNCWQMIDGKWYCFDESGYLRYGWILSGEKWYYCGDDGAMVMNTKTPDGYYIGGDGAWIQ